MLNDAPRDIAMGEIFLWYDGPHLFEGLGEGAVYILVSIPCEDDQWRYLVAEVTAQTMEQFKSGEIDCRDMFIDRRVGTLWTGDGFTGDGSHLTITPFHGLLFEDWLPEADLRVERDKPDHE